MQRRVHNFNPGPAALPLEVLEQAQAEFVHYGKTGMSVMEMSHRSGEIERLFEETGRLLLEAMGLRAGYTACFIGGGASMQFAMVPLNFLHGGRIGSYVSSGSFADKAHAEAATVGRTAIAASSKDKGWRELPDIAGLSLESDTAYIHMTTNNTIEGSQFRSFPDTGAVPLIGDMTSDILSGTIDYGRFAMIYASAQKNLGPAGVTVAVIRDEMLDACAERIPAILSYRTYAKHQSLYNTAPVHTVYMMKLVLEWLNREGGVTEMERRNTAKAACLYDAIDRSGGFYEGVIARPDRSAMNITWRLPNEESVRRFLVEAEREGFDGLAGHRSVGGVRASAYNAVSVRACGELADFMGEYARRHG